MAVPPDMFGVQGMRWGLAVGKCLPCVLLLVNPCNSLETEGLLRFTNPGSERLEGIMNTPRRAQDIWESLKHSSSSFWSSRELAARSAAATESTSLP